MRKSVLLWVSVATLVGFANRGSGSETGRDEGNVQNTGVKQRKSLDLSFIPEDCFLVAVVRPRRLAGSPLARKLSAGVTEELLREMTRTTEERDINPCNMEEIVVLFSPRELTGEKNEDEPPSDGAVVVRKIRDDRPFERAVIVRFAEPIANKRLMHKMFESVNFADGQAKHEGRAYYLGYRHGGWVPPKKLQHLSPGELQHLTPEQLQLLTPEERRQLERPADLAVHLPDDRTIAFSYSEAALKKVLSANMVKGDLVERLRRIDPDNDLIIVATAKGLGDSIEKLAKRPETNMPVAAKWLLRILKLSNAATFTVDLAGHPLAKLMVQANDVDSAVKLKKLADDEILPTAKSLGNAPQREGRLDLDLFEAVLKEISVTQHGKDVTVTLKKPEALARLPEILTPIAETQRERRDRLERRVKTAGQVGMIVVYEVDKDRTPPGSRLTAPDIQMLTAAINRRLNPGGRTSGRLRQLDGGRIEVSVFHAHLDVMRRIADLLPRPGTLEFRVLANDRDHPKLIERAKATPDGRTLRDEAGNLLAWWVPVQERMEKVVGGQKEIARRNVTRGNRKVLEVLVVNDKFNVTGAHLEQTVAAEDFVGRPCVAFTLNEVGTRLFRGLTESILPDQAQGFCRKLGIIIDGEVCSAPVVTSAVYRAAEITGDFTPEQVQDLVDLLNAGALPTAIRKVEQRVVDVEKQPSR